MACYVWMALYRIELYKIVPDQRVSLIRKLFKSSTVPGGHTRSGVQTVFVVRNM